MSLKQNPVSALESRKQLLVAESELNRARLLQEWQTLGDGLASLADRVRAFGTMASATKSLLDSFATVTNGKPTATPAKSSWFQKVADGARLASTIWLGFRSRAADS